jgi:hypothetical protein
LIELRFSQELSTARDHPAPFCFSREAENNFRVYYTKLPIIAARQRLVKVNQR